MASSILTIPIAVAGKGGKGKPKGEPRYDVLITGDIVGFRENAIYGTQLNGATKTFVKPIEYISPIDGELIVLTDKTYPVGQIAFYKGHQYCRITVYYDMELPYRVIHIFVYDAEVIRYKHGDQKGDIENVYDGVPPYIIVQELVIEEDGNGGSETKATFELPIALEFTIYYDLIE